MQTSRLHLKPSVLALSIWALSTAQVQAAEAPLTTNQESIATSSTPNTNTQTPTATTQPLATIVVTAAGFEQKLVDAPASITVITQDDFKNKRINSVADALIDVEGVDISPTAGKTGGLNIRMRGMDAEYTLLLIDGRRQNSTGDITPNGFGESNNNFIPPLSAIERIEVIRGPMSTLYGSDAMGGVVNIITKKVADQWTGALTLDATVLPNSSDFGNQRAADLYVSGPLIADLLGAQLRARKTERDQSEVGYLDVAGKDIELNMGNNPTKSELETIGARLTLTPHADHDIAVDYETTEQSFDNSKGQLGTLGADGGYAATQQYRRDKMLLAHTWRTGFGTLDSSITNNATETEGRLIPSRAQNGAQRISPRLLESEDTVFDTKFSSQALDQHQITVGGQWWEASISDGLRAQKEISFDQLGLFAEDTWAFRDNLAITTGLRFDDHSKFGDFVTPRIYAVWNTTDQWTIKGGYSEGYKVPRLERLTNGIYNVGGQGRSPLFGNPDLKPETSNNLELGVYFDNDANFNINVTGFYSEIEDKIVTGNNELTCDAAINKAECERFMASVGTPWLMQNGDTAANRRTWNVTRPVNAESAELYGIETNANWDLNDDLRLSANYTWTETKIQDSKLGNPKLTDTPEHIFNASLKWQAADDIQLWLRGEYRSERARYTKTYANLTAAEREIFDNFGDYKAYSLLHVGSNFAVNENVDIGIAFYNIFDTDFMSYELVPNTTTYTNRYSNSQEGRRVQLSTTFKF